VTKIKAWDVCAAEAVIRAAGGEMTDLKGNPLYYTSESPVFKNGLVATAEKELHAWYLQKLENYEMVSKH
jgi:3'(2'), 5'-bisphosphate nucleotidase